MVVSLKLEGPIAFVRIDNPPVNALSHAVRGALSDIVKKCDADPDTRAVVLCCAGKTFVAGADLKEFGQEPRAPFLPDLLNEIEASSTPWTAALHGAVLGGGLELAMACRARVAEPNTRLGLPEVALGLIPGAGGTVRLPRLISPLQALQMIAGGKPILAPEALEIGLIDRIAGGDLAQEAAVLAERAGRFGPTLQRSPKAVDSAAFDGVASKLLSKAKGQESTVEAISAVRRTLTSPSALALTSEREAFLRLKASPQSAALRHIFFAERATLKDPRVNGESRIVEKIGVVGGGMMGAGISAAALLAGFEVTMVERDFAAAQAGAQRVEDILTKSQKRGLISDERRQSCLAAFGSGATYSALANAGLVIEAVFEDFKVKRDVFQNIEAAAADAIIATNTSYLDVGALAAALLDPSRVIGLHFFSPAHVMKLLEIVLPETTSPEAAATGAMIAKRMGKIAVISGVCDGFIGNRIMSAYRRAADYLVEDGATPWAVDAAMRNFGMPIGVFEMQDLAGLDISWAMRKRRAAARPATERYVRIADRICEAGRLGRKTGSGWYDYSSGRAEPDPWVEEVIEKERAAKSIKAQSFDEAQIMARILGAMQAEGEAVLAEGIARSADDIDVAMVNGYGFPRWRGGPMFMLRQTRGKT